MNSIEVQNSESIKLHPTAKNWTENKVIQIKSKGNLLSVVKGRFPVGLLEKDIITEEERTKVLMGLSEIPIKKYDNTDETEQVKVYGIPFVDSTTLNEYLYTEVDPRFELLTGPLLEKLIHVFKNLGFNVNPLIDPITKRKYHSKVIREISVPEGCFKSDGNVCTVAHCDDIIRDGFLKPDFRVPKELISRSYNQFSVCIQLENGGYRPDQLRVYDLKYSPELEPEFDGWRAPRHILELCDYYDHIPQLKQSYLFCTQNIHDVLGGHKLSKRINFSVFFIHVEGTKNLFYYN